MSTACADCTMPGKWINCKLRRGKWTETLQNHYCWSLAEQGNAFAVNLFKLKCIFVCWESWKSCLDNLEIWMHDLFCWNMTLSVHFCSKHYEDPVMCTHKLSSHYICNGKHIDINRAIQHFLHHVKPTWLHCKPLLVVALLGPRQLSCMHARHLKTCCLAHWPKPSHSKQMLSQ